jgi:hypothetical protein
MDVKEAHRPGPIQAWISTDKGVPSLLGPSIFLSSNWIYSIARPQRPAVDYTHRKSSIIRFLP